MMKIPVNTHLSGWKYAFSYGFLLLTKLSCKETMTQKEVENAPQLKEAIIIEALKEIKPRDTLFIVTSRVLGVCGNDPQYDGFTTPSEKLAELNYIKQHPYFIDVHKDFKEKYVIDRKVAVTGEAFDNEFTTSSKSFTYDEEKNEKLVYDLQFPTVKKDTVHISITDYYHPENKRVTFKMVKENSKWLKYSN